MTAAGDRREELEALLWGESIPAPVVAKILASADAYAKAFARAPRKPPGAPVPRSVHYAPAVTGRPVCRPGDPLSARNWVASPDPAAVTCGHCRRNPAWQEAAR